ncbi:hypothetical protein NE237_020636 [Protea cynaroides]|uniref:Uncharacterized protein n=1 Tax=Protea cynaroides TaxID=273540 RepID=A0A9Q0H6C5_9MAGN|nr:hypothetical protein NE237_020636 [Protea cynaroides]
MWLSSSMSFWVPEGDDLIDTALFSDSSNSRIGFVLRIEEANPILTVSVLLSFSNATLGEAIAIQAGFKEVLGAPFSKVLVESDCFEEILETGGETPLNDREPAPAPAPSSVDSLLGSHGQYWRPEKKPLNDKEPAPAPSSIDSLLGSHRQSLIQSLAVNNFYFGEGSDFTGVSTKMLIMNCSLKMSLQLARMTGELLVPAIVF